MLQRTPEGKDMISWRLVVPAVLCAAAVAGCITYFFSPVPPQPVAADQPVPLTLPNVTAGPDTGISTNTQRQITEEEDHAIAYQRAAEAILKRAQNAKASADEPLVTAASRCLRSADPAFMTQRAAQRRRSDDFPLGGVVYWTCGFNLHF